MSIRIFYGIIVLICLSMAFYGIFVVQALADTYQEGLLDEVMAREQVASEEGSTNEEYNPYPEEGAKDAARTSRIATEDELKFMRDQTYGEFEDDYGYHD